MVEITPGTTYTFDTADSGNASYGDAVGTEYRYANYDTSNNEAESFAQTSLIEGGNYHAWAEVGKDVTPTDTAFADVTVDGNYRAKLRWVFASAEFRLRLIIYNKTDDVYEDTLTVKSASSDPLIKWSDEFSSSVSNNVSANLEKGKTYRLGVRTDSTAEGVPVETATSDVARPGTGYTGYFNYDTVTVEWPNM